MGKGDIPRPMDKKKFDRGWERTFKKKNRPAKPTPNGKKQKGVSPDKPASDPP